MRRNDDATVLAPYKRKAPDGGSVAVHMPFRNHFDQDDQ